MTSTLSENGTLSAWAEEWITKYKSDRATENDDDWEVIEDEVVILENENIRFTLDGYTTHFQVENKHTGRIYTSYPENAEESLDEEAEIKITSNLSITYYDANSTKGVMGSGPDSVDKENYQIKRQGNTIRIYYTLGSSANQIFAPAVCSQEVFETQILDRLSSDSRRRRLSAYYTAYSWDDQDPDAKEIAKKYPALKETPLYVLQDDLSDAVLQEITTYVTQSGFTKEDYAAECNRLNIDPEEETNLPVGFVVPLELSLQSDGFSASILTDKISITNTDYHLQSVSLLDYFGTVRKEAEGYFVVPDGAGALIDLNQPDAGNFVQKMYSNDGAIAVTEQQQLSRNLTLPLFGFRQDGEGFLAVMEEGEAAATISAEVAGEINPYARISASFDLVGMDQTNIGEDRNIPLLNLYAGHLSYDCPSIRYILLDQEHSSYSAMAVRYREYLIEREILKEQLKEQEIPFYLDILCMYYQDTGTIGNITLGENVVLSNFEQIDALIQQLQDRGIKKIYLRLKGYGPNGLSTGPQDGISINRKLGTEQQLLAIQEQLEKNGGKLFLDFNVMFAGVDQPFNSFRSAVDAAQDLNRETVIHSGYDIVTLAYGQSLEPRMLVSPAAYRTFADKMIQTYTKLFDKSNIGLGLSDAGKYLYSDFSKKADYDLNMTAAAITDIITYCQNHVNAIWTDYGNYYSLPADYIVNIPSGSSRYNMETSSIPFYQIVVHGYKNYANEPFNLSGMENGMRLDLLECAGAPYAVWITQDDLVYSDTDFKRLNYSLYYKNNIEELVDYYQEIVTLYQGLQTSSIVNHYKINELVSAVEYEEGSVVYINRGTEPYWVDGNRIDAGKAVRIS